MQDLVALAVAVVAIAWLARSLSKRLLAPPCRPPDAPAGADGFVPLDSLTVRKPRPCD